MKTKKPPPPLELGENLIDEPCTSFIPAKGNEDICATCLLPRYRHGEQDEA